MASSLDGPSHVALLSDSLQRLHTHQESTPDSHIIRDPQSPTPRSPHSRDGYGFRISGVSTPLTHVPNLSQLSTELVPDPNGLGWPGE